ncbi:MAG: helix-hairpin-helix domain-containing protein, partial [Bacteroidota bacterium]
MKNSPFYRYSKSQRKGIIALFLVVIIIQSVYYVFNTVGVSSKEKQSEAETQWLAHQDEINDLKAQKQGKKDTIYPFNPNYITDYKGYVRGMSNVEIDKLLAYRKSGKWINSTADFKHVTGVQDSLLNRISPY